MFVAIDRLIERLEARGASPISLLLTLFSLILLRNVLEGLLEEKHLIGLHETMTISLIDFFLQNGLFFIALFLSLCILFHLLARVPIERVVKSLIIFYAIILIVPLIDFLFSGGRGYYLGYPVTPKSSLRVMIHFFDPRVSLKGIPVGLRVEVFLACLAGMMYVGRKTRSWWRTLLTPLSLYIVVLFHGFFPFLGGVLLKIVFQVPGPFSELESTFTDLFFSGEALPYSGLRLSLLWLFWISYLLLLWFYRYDRSLMGGWLQQIRSGRLLHLPSQVLVGFFCGFLMLRVPGNHILGHPFGVLAILGLVLSGLQAGIIMDWVRQKSLTGEWSSMDAEGSCHLPSTEFPSQGFVMLVMGLISTSMVLLVNLLAAVLLVSFYALIWLLWFPPFKLARHYWARILAGVMIDLVFLGLGAFLVGGIRTPLIIGGNILAVAVALSTGRLMYLEYLELFQGAQAKGFNRTHFVLTPAGKTMSLFVQLLLLLVTAVISQAELFWVVVVVLWLILVAGYLAGESFRRPALLVSTGCWVAFIIMVWGASGIGWQRLDLVKQEKILLARDFFNQGSYHQALEQYRQIMEIESDSSRTTIPLEMGIASLKINDGGAALESFDLYLEHNPFSRDALVGRAIALETLGDLPRALAIYKDLIDRGLSSPRVRLMFGISLTKSGRYEDALVQFDEISSMQATMPQILMYRGDTLLELKRFDEAAAAYRRFAELSVDPKMKTIARQRLGVLSSIRKKEPPAVDP